MAEPHAALEVTRGRRAHPDPPSIALSLSRTTLSFLCIAFTLRLTSLLFITGLSPLCRYPSISVGFRCITAFIFNFCLLLLEHSISKPILLLILLLLGLLLAVAATSNCRSFGCLPNFLHRNNIYDIAIFSVFMALFSKAATVRLPPS